MRPDRYGRLRRVLAVAVALLAAAIGVTVYATDALDSLELTSVDSRFRLRGTQPEPPHVAVVDIDDASLRELGERWPLPRSLHAHALDRLAAAGARTVVYDVVFLGRSQPEQDEALRRAIARSPKIVVATDASDASGSPILGEGHAEAEALGAVLGSTRAPPDAGGVIRRTVPSVSSVGALSHVAAELHLGRELPSDDLEWIDYAGPAGAVRSARFSDLVAGRVPDELLRGRAVVVGPSAASVGDLFPTPTAQHELMPGAEIQANALQTAIDGYPLSDLPATATWLLVLSCAAAASSVLLVRPAIGAVVVCGAAAGLAALAHLAFLGGVIVPVVAPAVALATAAVGAISARAITGALQRQHQRDLFARFVPETVVDRAIAQAGPDLRASGTEMDATVLFSDLRGFTAFSEQLAPAAVIQELNRYLESMSDAILDHGGTLVAYMGDGIMAVFGAPVAQADHADRALAAAREMSGERLRRFNASLTERGLEHRFSMGIGINSGPVLSGYVGSIRRLEYTALGDTTNTASRLEAMTKGTPHQVFVSQETVDRLASPDGLAFVRELPVRGRAAPVRIWSFRGP